VCCFKLQRHKRVVVAMVTDGGLEYQVT